MTIDTFFIGIGIGFLLIYMLSVFSGKKAAKQIVINLSMNTEADEQITAQIRLPSNSTKHTIYKAINNYSEALEMRRDFQYKRMEEIRRQQLERAKEMAKEEGGVSLLAKKQKEKK